MFSLHCCYGIGSIDPNLVEWWPQGHLCSLYIAAMGLGRSTQTLWKGLGSSMFSLHCCYGFGSIDQNLVEGFLGSSMFSLHCCYGFGSVDPNYPYNPAHIAADMA